MGWELTIDGDAASLNWLVRKTSQVSPRIIEVDTARRLEWVGLETLGFEQHNEMELSALRHLVSLSGLASVLLCRHASLRMIDVSFRRSDGTRHVIVAISDTIRVGATVEVELTTFGQDGQPKRVPPFDPIPHIAALAEIDETVQKVLRLSSGDLNDWTALYRLYEVLLDAAGGTVGLAALGVSREQLKVFTGTANSPALSGDASRHGVQTGSPPSTSVSLPDAVLMLRQLSRLWLIARASP